MKSLDQEGKVVYISRACPGPRSGDGRTSKIFPALERLANLCPHIPNRGEQMVRYYGRYSKKGVLINSIINLNSIQSIIISLGVILLHMLIFAKILERILIPDIIKCTIFQ